MRPGERLFTALVIGYGVIAGIGTLLGLIAYGLIAPAHHGTVDVPTAVVVGIWAAAGTAGSVWMWRDQA